MAYDKVTKIDSIAKRKPHTKVNLGVLVEYDGAYNRGETFAQFKVADTIAQRTVSIGRSGKMRRDIRISSGQLVTNFARGTSARAR